MTGYHPPPSPVVPKDRGLPSTDSHRDEALALGRADRSPASAFIAFALAVASLALLWFGRAMLWPALCLAVVAILVAVLAWATARRRLRPAGVAVAALGLGAVVAVIVLVLWS
jgi:hypothetical protein